MARVDFYTSRVTQLRAGRRGKGRKEERWRKEREARRSKDGSKDGRERMKRREGKRLGEMERGRRNGCTVLQNLL